MTAELGRLRLARLIVEQGWPVARAAERFQVSRTTAHRWAGRYRDGAWSGWPIGPAALHFTFFTKSGSEQPIDGANATMTTSSGKKQSIDLQLLAAGHFAANLNLPTGQVSFTINATPAQGPPITASLSQQIK